MNFPAVVICVVWSSAVVWAGWLCWEGIESRRWADVLAERKSQKGFIWRRNPTLERRQVMMVFPDFLDLMGLAISSGLPFDRAWLLASSHMSPGALKNVLQATHHQLQFGRSREDSLRDLSQRIGDRQLRMFFALLIQSIQTGNRLQSVLHDFAATLRRQRMNELEKRAQTASLRLLFPMFLFIFPTIFLILFAPLAIRFSRGGGIF